MREFYRTVLLEPTRFLVFFCFLIFLALIISVRTSTGIGNSPDLGSTYRQNINYGSLWNVHDSLKSLTVRGYSGLLYCSQAVAYHFHRKNHFFFYFDLIIRTRPRSGVPDIVSVLGVLLGLLFSMFAAPMANAIHGRPHGGKISNDSRTIPPT